MSEGQSNLARRALQISIIGTGTALLGIVLVQLGLISPMLAFFLFGLGAIAGGALTLILGIVSAFKARGDFESTRRNQARIAVVVGAALLGAVILAGLPGRGLPPINDITTDPDDPPAFSAVTVRSDPAGRDMRYPPEFVELARAAYPDLATLRSALPPAAAMTRARASARSLGWEVTYVGPDGLDATHQTRIFRFVDDITIRVRPDGGGSLIDVRSKSRDGRGDLGANAARIRAFLTHFQAG